MIDLTLAALGLRDVNSGVGDGEWTQEPGGEEIASVNPTTGTPLARVLSGGTEDYQRTVESASKAFVSWRMTPAPQRGEIVRELGQALRERKRELGLLVALEMGKIRSEGEGEVQEMIDMCDFAVGLSRQLHGLTIASERPRHRMFEQWHPLGPIGVITAFNFPVAVWAWNAAVAAACGDTVIWKPSSETPLTAVAVQHIAHGVMKKHGLQGVFNLCVGGGSTVGEAMIHDRRLPLISATGSCRMGRHVASAVAGR
ncbi:MAG: aldehyde dehydrogenase family protein, partial [Planctomycetales bacterium]